MAHDLKLYHYWRSSCSWRLRWALAAKRITYTLQHIDLLKGEHREASYLHLNPLGYVPTLLVNGTAHSDSLAIIEWLEEVCPLPQLLPTSPKERLQVRELTYIISSATQPLQNMSVQRRYAREPAERQKYARYHIHRGFAAYEARLAALGGGTFSYGASITLADICLIPQVYNAMRFACEMSRFPRIQHVYERCLQEKNCAGSAPEIFRPVN